MLAAVRDFQPANYTNLNGLDDNPDFENCIASETGIVATALGADQKPVYAAKSAPRRGPQALHSYPPCALTPPNLAMRWRRMQACVRGPDCNCARP